MKLSKKFGMLGLAIAGFLLSSCVEQAAEKSQSAMNSNAAEYFNHPKYLINAAVNPTTLQGTPAGGWNPQEKISVEASIKAYTINGAEATFEGDVRGSIKTGKFADLVIVDRNLFNIPPADLINMEIDLTMVDGKVVYERVAN